MKETLNNDANKFQVWNKGADFAFNM